jgi:hypothetical protein
MANGWTQARRQRQAELIRQWQPWNNSTGARTAEGKTIASRNAYKGGTRPAMRQLARLLRDQRECLEAIA